MIDIGSASDRVKPARAVGYINKIIVLIQSEKTDQRIGFIEAGIQNKCLR